MQIKDLIPWNRREVARGGARGESNSLLGLQRDMNRLFDRFWDQFDWPFDGRGAGAALPKVDVAETDKSVEVSVELPGLDEKDVEVALTEGQLAIKGEKKVEREESRQDYYLAERSYGAFHRVIPLPAGTATDGATATFKKGVLTVTVSKTPEARDKVKRIEVKGG
ncbi:MAG: Hsp20/alpha crystallin family protein [Alphaproteobacteria bacterium]